MILSGAVGALAEPPRLKWAARGTLLFVAKWFYGNPIPLLAGWRILPLLEIGANCPGLNYAHRGVCTRYRRSSHQGGPCI